MTLSAARHKIWGVSVLRQLGSHVDGPLIYNGPPMRWGKFFGVRPKDLPTWLALCVGHADGSNPQYLAQAKHAIMVMVRATEAEKERTIFSLLQSNGWREPTIRDLKMLDEPFCTDDPIWRSCYERAARGEGGIVVYSDRIEDV